MYKLECKELKKIQGFLKKRQKRIEEIKEHIGELRERNREIQSNNDNAMRNMKTKEKEKSIVSSMEILNMLEKCMKEI